MATEGEVQAILEALENPARKHEWQGMYDQNPVAFVAADRMRINRPKYRKLVNEARWGRGLLPWEKEPEKYRELINKARYGGDGTPPLEHMPIQEILPDIYNFITSEKNKYSQLPRANYSGKQIASKSPLTGRAEQLVQRYANKGVPNENKVNRLLARNPRGLSPENLNEIKNFLDNQRRNYIENNSLNILKDRFRDPFSDQNIDKFRRKGQKDLTDTQNVFNEKLREFGSQLGLYEDASNLEKVKLLMDHGKSKSSLRNRSIETLKNFGNQQHAYENMQIEANKNNFNRAANKPYQNIELLESAIEPYRLEAERKLKKNTAREKYELARQSNINAGNEDSYGDYVDTDIDRSSLPNSGFYDALKNYGLDMKSSSKNLKVNYNNQPTATQQIADLPKDLQGSYNEMLRFNPRLVETNREQRKNLTNGILNEATIGDQITEQVPMHVRERIAQAEKEGKKTLEKELAMLTNKYVQMNQYGSSSHQAAAAHKARELNKQIMNLRNNILEEGLGVLTTNRKNEDSNKMARLSLLEHQKEDQINHALNNTILKNTKGYNQFTNRQNRFDDRFKTDYENEMYRWPHLRSAIMGGQLPIPAFPNRNNNGYEE